MARVEIPEVVLDSTGVPVLGASVQVNHRGGGAATVYSAETGAGTVSNPIITGALGRIEGWVEPGSYDLVVNGVYTQRFEAAVGGSAVPVFNVKDGKYGAKGDGTTDDTAAIQAAIDAAIAAGGGRVVLPQGTYRTTASLDFSSMKGSPRGVSFEGAGRGDIFGTTLFATRIDSDHTGPCIKAYGELAGATNLFIANLVLKGFGIKHLQNIGSNYSIDFDYVWSGFELDKIFIWGNTKTGRGVQIRNFAHGQGRVNQVTVRNFATGGSIGFRLAVEVTANVDVAPNSGNLTMENCAAYDVDTGFQFGGSNLMNGCTFNALKAVISPARSGSVGFHVQFQMKQSVFNNCHSENAEVGFWLQTCEFNDFVACGAYHPSALIDANTCGFLFDGAVSCRVTGHVQKTHYGARFINDSLGNSANIKDRTAARVVTAMYDEQSTNPTNLMVEGEVNPWTWIFGKVLMTFAGFATTSVVHRYRVQGDSNFRHRVYADGKHEYNEDGSGNIRLATSMLTGSWGFLSSRGFAQPIFQLTYSASITPTCRNGGYQYIDATNTSAFTINAPTNPPDAGSSMELTIEIRNTAGSALGAVTWNGVFKWTNAGNTQPGNPATGKRRQVTFRYDGTNWIEQYRSAADY